MSENETRSEAIEKLNATISKLKRLKPEKFNYGTLVKEGTIKGNKACGTVCCVAGWYPKWFPESKLLWAKSNITVSGYCLVAVKDINEPFLENSDVMTPLIMFHKFDKQVIGCLFFGEKLRNDLGDEIAPYLHGGVMDTMPLDTVLKRFETVRDHLELCLLENNLVY